MTIGHLRHQCGPALALNPQLSRPNAKSPMFGPTAIADSKTRAIIPVWLNQMYGSVSAISSGLSAIRTRSVAA
jgi:hypothetical protein